MPALVMPSDELIGPRSGRMSTAAPAAWPPAIASDHRPSIRALLAKKSEPPSVDHPVRRHNGRARDIASTIDADDEHVALQRRLTNWQVVHRYAAVWRENIFVGPRQSTGLQHRERQIAGRHQTDLRSAIWPRDANGDRPSPSGDQSTDTHRRAPDGRSLFAAGSGRRVAGKSAVERWVFRKPRVHTAIPVAEALRAIGSPGAAVRRRLVPTARSRIARSPVRGSECDR